MVTWSSKEGNLIPFKFQTGKRERKLVIILCT